jgi:hypothetical protein
MHVVRCHPQETVADFNVLFMVRPIGELCGAAQ